MASRSVDRIASNVPIPDLMDLPSSDGGLDV
jgi:hypothetical protein